MFYLTTFSTQFINGYMASFKMEAYQYMGIIRYKCYKIIFQPKLKIDFIIIVIVIRVV